MAPAFPFKKFLSRGTRLVHPAVLGRPHFLSEAIENCTKQEVALAETRMGFEPLTRVMANLVMNRKHEETWEPFKELQGFVRLAWQGNEGAITLLLYLGLADQEKNLVL